MGRKTMRVGGVEEEHWFVFKNKLYKYGADHAQSGAKGDAAHCP